MTDAIDTIAPAMETGTVPSARGVADQAAVFRRLRVRIARNGLRVAWESGKARLFTMLGTSAIVALLVFGLSGYAFYELFQFKIPVKGLIVGGLFDLMFFTLGGMLLFSTGIILYASLFTSPEARFLLTTPARADRIFASAFQGAVGFSSWAFLILGLPILVAYGIVAGVPWYFYPLLPVYLLGFVLLPGSMSAVACLLLVRFLPRNRRQVLTWGSVVVVLLFGVWLVRVGIAARSSWKSGGNKDEVEGLIGQFQLVRHPLAPSHWMTTGVMAAARDDVGGALLPLAAIWSNGLLAYLAAAYAASRLYRTAFDRVSGSGRGKKVFRASPLDRVMEGMVFYLDRPTRVLVVKDFRTFRRDPTQWVLLAIFAGMIGVGATNFRQFYTADLDRIEKYSVGLINLAGVSVLLCAGLSRFVFPLISLEGRKFWVLGLMPVRREQILAGKFAFAATGSVMAAFGMVVGSELLLGLPLGPMVVHAITALCVAVGLSAMNVGLGAYMPNFRETDPSKIVVGFSGTVNMVLGLMYLVVVIGVMALPLHAAALMRHYGKISGAELPWWGYAGVPIGVALALAATILPMRAGARALRDTEF